VSGPNLVYMALHRRANSCFRMNTDTATHMGGFDRCTRFWGGQNLIGKNVYWVGAPRTPVSVTARYVQAHIVRWLWGEGQSVGYDQGRLQGGGFKVLLFCLLARQPSRIA
jgi:hypothetical protein